MSLTPVAMSSQDDDVRWTQKVVKNQPDVDRAQIGRYFVGFHCEVELDNSGYRSTVQVAVEGVAWIQTGDYVAGLVTTAGANIHALDCMKVYPLSKIRSIKTVRRF